MKHYKASSVSVFSLPLLLGVAIFFSLSVHAASAPLSSHVTLEELAEHVDKNGITRLDDLIRELPPMMKSNAMLGYDSRALNIHLISPETPRIVLFNQDATLILAMTKNPGEEAVTQGLDKLEVINFNKATGKFEFRDVAFDGKPSPFSRNAEVNPPVCLACHGQNPRPIFDDYNAWPGFYGSFSQRGYAVSGTPEFNYFSDFLKSYAGVPRYKDLDLSRITRDANGIRYPSFGFGGLYDTASFTPLLAFGTSVEFLMWQRLGKKIDLNKKSSKLINLITAIGTGDQCGGHREIVKELFKAWMAATKHEARAKQIASSIEKQVRIETANKLGRFAVFNTADTALDPRGFMTLPFETFFPATPRSRSAVDKTFFENQFVIFEAMAKELEIETSDVSTSQHGITTGVFHIRKLTLLPDEQLFEGLLDGLKRAGPVQLAKPLNASMALSCQARFDAAKTELLKLEVPDPDLGGLFFTK